MTPLRTVTSVAAPLLRDNIDTDAIIPSREIRSATKSGLADGLFAGWRYRDAARTPDPDFILNQPPFREAAILLGGSNFGCGSSREQAAWALAEYGIRVIVAPSFNPIFRRNCIRNGILPAERDPRPIAVAADGKPITVDLVRRLILGSSGEQWPFEIEAEAATMLLEGLDEIALTLTQSDLISRWQAADRASRPWAYLGSGEAA